MATRTITLATAFVGREKYASKNLKILKIDDDPEIQSLRAHVQLGGDEAFRYWVQVQIGVTYTDNWTDQDVVNAVTAFFTVV